MRMRRPVTSPAPARHRPSRISGRRIAVTAALSGFAVVAVAVVVEFVLTHALVPASRPSLTLGAMVTMVGPLGVTFPCWAAGHVARRAPDASDPH